MYTVCKTFEIESGHILSKHPDRCHFPHGHSRKVEVILESEDLDEVQMVCDFKIPKLIIGEYLDQLDHAMCLNEEDPLLPMFKKHYGERIIVYKGEPTTELMAKTIFDIFKDKMFDYKGPYVLRSKVKLVKVRVSETSSSWAEYCKGD